MRIAASLLVGALVVGSDPPVPPVRFDAVVTDAQGRPIVDLRPGDFEIRENGAARPLSAVQLRTHRPAADTRAFAIVLDEYHVAAGEPSSRVRASLRRFVDEQLGPGDVVAIVKPLDAVATVPFTADRDAMRRAIDSFAGRKGDYTPRNRFEREYIGHAPAAIETARAQIVSAALRELSMRLGGIASDRGVIVLVSEGFTRAPAAELRQIRVPDLLAMVRAAGRFHLVLYGFNPADEAGTFASTLEWLAAETGGRAELDGAALDAGFAAMSADLNAYYALTYQPAQADGRFHPVEIVAKRKDAQVRSRPGYWAPLGSELRALLTAPSGPEMRRALRRSPAIDVWTGVTVGPGGRTRLTITWEPRGPQRAASLQISAAARGGAPLFEGTLAAVADEDGRLPRVASFDVPAGGRVELDMSVRSMAGASIDTDVRDVDVPDLSKRGKAPVILTPEIVRGRTAPEFRALSADPDAPPTPDRSFSRGDRLLIRIPVWSASGAPIQVTATVTNAIGGAMRAIDRTDLPDDRRARFELPLAWLAPGNYQVMFTAKDDSGASTESVRFSVR